MSETDPVLLFTQVLEDLGLAYMVTGSVAGILYGEPRVTHDVDIVLVLPPQACARLAAAFPQEEFYVPPPEVLLEEARRAQRGHFNLIHHKTGFRADVYLASRDPLHRWALDKRLQLPFAGRHLFVAPLEYVVVRKLEYYREGHSEKHLRDIESMLRVSGDDADRDAIEAWVDTLGLQPQWARVSSTQAQ